MYLTNMQTKSESWAGVILAWIPTVGMWEWAQGAAAIAMHWLMAYGLPIMVTASTVWYTVEKARRERAMRNMYEEAVRPQRRSLLGVLLGRPASTDSMPLQMDDDMQSQSHHDGKNSR